MADDKWFSQLESRIFTLVSYRVKKALSTKYPKIKYTAEGQSDSSPHFPTWYMHEIQNVETGQDLENSEINAVMQSIEIIVYAKDKKEAKEIMTESVVQMKALRYNVVAMPIITTDGNVYSNIARFRRIIGAGDSDIVV